MTIDITGNGSVTRTPEGTEISSGVYTYDKNQEVTLIAEPASGYEFEQWIGLDAETVSTTIVMDENRQIGVIFSESDEDEQSQVATPTFTPAGGEYESSQEVTINCSTSGAIIYYTTDGSDPTQSSTEYTGSISISEDTIIKARAYKEDMQSSEIASAEYNILLPDQVLFIRQEAGNYGIYKMDIVNGESENIELIKQLTGNRDYANANYEIGGPRWSAVREQIVFIDPDGNDEEIYIMDEDGSDLKQVTDNPDGEFFANWAPNGEKIVFESDRDHTKSELYIRDIDGSTIRRLTNNNAHDWYPDWSPGGHRILFASDRDGDFEIYTCDLYGEDVVQLTDNDSDDKYPVWSSDGEKIVFASDRYSGEGEYDIYVMDKDGDNVKQLTDNTAAEVSPVWSDNDDKIVFASDVDGDYAIYMIDSTGYNRKQLTEQSGFDGFPEWK
ncbi:MAG: chitobiase/beta-hexosaminidase C-terminal domain-containing protein [Halanaerobiales bacterium]